MAKLEELRAGSFINGLAPSSAAKVVHLEWFGDQAVKATCEESSGAVRNRLVFRNEEPTLELVSSGRPLSFDGDGALLRLVSEACRIQLAHLFDIYLAIHTSRIEPLPHQVTAVYGEMLPRQPLRFLLAEDPGAGKTIMAGFFIKELMIRGNVERCLTVAPGSLVEQWQDELSDTQKELVGEDYSMPNGKTEIPVRKASRYCAPRRLGLDWAPAASHPHDQQIVLLNREAVQAVLAGQRDGVRV